MKICSLIFALTFAVSSSAMAGLFFGKPDISGSYTCQWHDLATNALYESSLLVSKLRVSYLFSWTSSNGKQYIGNGLFNEKDDSFIAVIYNVLGQPKVEQGIQLYHIDSDGTLTGPWLTQDKTQHGIGVCKRNKTS